MQFETEGQKECYEKILPWMKELFGIYLKVREDVPSFGVIVGSAYTQVGVYPWGKNEATITTRSYVVTNINIVEDLMDYLLHENDRMRFGAFGLDSDNDIFFEHTILGSTSDKEEIKSSILAVVYTADEYDDIIRQRWGGERAIDRS